MPTFADRATMVGARYDGYSGDELARRLSLPAVVVYDEVGSTLDVAHRVAGEGAPAGTLVLADRQTAGRGRLGRTWTSEPSVGIWLTLIERPRDVNALDVLSLRVGIALAPALEAFADYPIQLKWPNDVYVHTRKLAGVLVEARWRDAMPEWIAIGVGINIRPPESETRAAGLRADAIRLDVLGAAIPAIRAAASTPGMLSASEVDDFSTRDLAAGRSCIEPVEGTVRGIDARGSLLVGVGSHTVAVRTGSLVFKEAL